MICELFGLTFNAATRYTRPYQDTATLHPAPTPIPFLAAEHT
ncbi:hypothetical protein [Streptomyces sp. NBC_00568]|nr:hypothetical protein [Streptomyces sp. NBC_00568]MCX4993684.1 hypothetical protein [Streptomyces sp. NBC_00568]